MNVEFAVTALTHLLSGVIETAQIHVRRECSDRFNYGHRIATAIVEGLVAAITGRDTKCGPDYSDEQCVIAGEMDSILRHRLMPQDGFTLVTDERLEDLKRCEAKLHAIMDVAGRRDSEFASLGETIVPADPVPLATPVKVSAYAGEMYIIVGGRNEYIGEFHDDAEFLELICVAANRKPFGVTLHGVVNGKPVSGEMSIQDALDLTGAGIRHRP